MGEEIHVYVALLANLYCTHWNSFFLKTPSENCNEYITGTEQKRLLLRKALLLGDARDAVSVLLGNPPPFLFLRGFPVKRLPSSFEWKLPPLSFFMSARWWWRCWVSESALTIVIWDWPLEFYRWPSGWGGVGGWPFKHMDLLVPTQKRYLQLLFTTILRQHCLSRRMTVKMQWFLHRSPSCLTSPVRPPTSC